MKCSLPSFYESLGCSMSIYFWWSPLKNVVLTSIWWISMFLNGHQSRIQQIDVSFARSENISLFIKRWNCIEMKRREITWAKCVTNYNHKTITCNKLIPTFKVFMCTQSLDRKEWWTTQNHSNIQFDWIYQHVLQFFYGFLRNKSIHHLWHYCSILIGNISTWSMWQNIWIFY
jgi:hypothetical protein